MPKNKECVKCKHSKSLDNFECSRYTLKSGEISIRYRSACNQCRVEERRERIKKEENYWKKQYWSMSEEKRKEYIKRKSEYNSARYKTDPKALARKKEYDKSDKGIYARYKSDSFRRKRLSRGINFDLTFEQFSTLINSSCDYCGKPNCRGIDRVNSSNSYTRDNCVPCCKICNQMKNSMTLEEFLDHISQVLKHRMESL